MHVENKKVMVDKTVELLKAKKLLELQKRLIKEQEEQKAKKAPEPQKMSPREILLSALFDRGDEVLDTAERTFPEQTRQIIDRLAELIEKGMLTEKISGGQLLGLFRRLGLRVSMNTQILVEEKGKMVSLADKLKSGK